MSRYGIIELGSNTIRLCIYEVSCAAHEPLRKKDIDTLLNYKVMAGLASHVEKGASYCKRDRIAFFATVGLRN